MNKGINKSRELLASWSEYNHSLLTCMLIYLRHSLQTPWNKFSRKTIKKRNQSTTRIQQCKTLTDALRYIAAKKIEEEKGRKYLVHTQEKRRTGGAISSDLYRFSCLDIWILIFFKLWVRHFSTQISIMDAQIWFISIAVKLTNISLTVFMEGPFWPMSRHEN